LARRFGVGLFVLSRIALQFLDHDLTPDCSAMAKGWQRGEHRFVVRSKAMDSCVSTDTTRDLRGNTPTDLMLARSADH
jgi:hypothetical protein